MTAINASIGFDQRLAEQDIAGSKAHSAMLAAQGLITEQDRDAIHAGLDRILADIRAGSFTFSEAHEDIHMNVEAALIEQIGEAGGRLHTARSRNDQVATDLRLWVRDALDETDQGLRAVQEALITQGLAHHDAVMPGFTHLQPAQPVTIGHHMHAYVEMFGRDRGRFADCRTRLNESPLGAAALAGTPYPIDRRMTAASLGFDRPMANSLDAVSARDFVLEYLAAASICAVHLSRLAEELVLWTTPQFRFVTLPERLTTGSSIMPQKRNPDAAELIRGKTGRVMGSLMGLLTTLKALPLAYSKDMQEDKEPVFDAHDTLMLALRAMAPMIEGLTVHREKLRAAAEPGHPTATDLADWLVRALGVPFREAHHITGRVVRLADDWDCTLPDLPLEAMKIVDPRITEEVREILTLEASVSSRTSEGGTAPSQVQAALTAAKERFL